MIVPTLCVGMQPGTLRVPAGASSLATKALYYKGMMIVPTLCVGMQPGTLRVPIQRPNAERPRKHSHALRGND
ncbi:hypothetical protein ASD60_13495 [Pseudomonas sp. Root562]|nr:hypothetical protein ASD60_13495 [Pseudomonas sp. Root562]